MSNITVSIREYTSESTGEVKQFMVVKHPDHDDAITLLRKKKVDGSRMSVEEMHAYLKENKNWRDRLSFATHPDHGSYFAISVEMKDTVLSV
jgi:hypothetical protein